jgi:beta-glucanase (GH16 family)
MDRYSRRLVRRARTRTRSTVAVAIVVVAGVSVSVAGAADYLFPLRSGESVAIGCDGSYLSQERLSSTIRKLTCTDSTDAASTSTTSTTGTPGASTSTTTSTTTTTSPPNIDGQPPGAVTGRALWTRVFSDEFNDNEVDATQWNVQDNSTFGTGNNELQCYMDANTTESGGSLNLTARAGGAGCSGYQVSSGMVTQRDQGGPQHFSFTHGYIEARIRVAPFGAAAWPAFWLVGAEGSRSWPDYGEMDIAEMYGPNPTIAEPNYHDNSGARGNVLANVGRVDGWHTYALNWTENTLTWFYDGNPVSSVNVTNNIAHSVILNYAIGGDGPAHAGFSGSPTPSLPSTMSVDYVRIWQP